MKFNGAVLVSNDKLGTFINVVTEHMQHYDEVSDKFYKDAQEWYESYWESKSFIGKILSSKETCPSAIARVYVKQKGFYWGMFDREWDILRKLGYLPNVSRWSMIHYEAVDPILNLFLCGELVYLNADQAALVNSFLNDFKPLQELLEEFNGVIYEI